MKFLKLLFLLIVILSCQSEENRTLQDCGTAYSFDDPKKEMEKDLHAKVRFILFTENSDTLNLIDSLYIVNSLNLLNNQLSEPTFGGELSLNFSLDSIVVIKSKEKKEDMPSLIRHASTYNKENVFNVYIYGDEQPYMIGEDCLVRGRAAAIVSRTMAVRYSYLNTSTLTHEMLHCLGLIHVHQKDTSDGYNVESGDLVCDTRAVSAEDFVDGDCNYVGPDISPDNPSKYECNLMSYINADCRKCLTEGQAKRVKFEIQGKDILRKCFNLPIAKI